MSFTLIGAFSDAVEAPALYRVQGGRRLVLASKVQVDKHGKFRLQLERAALTNALHAAVGGRGSVALVFAGKVAGGQAEFPVSLAALNAALAQGRKQLNLGVLSRAASSRTGDSASRSRSESLPAPSPAVIGAVGSGVSGGPRELDLAQLQGALREREATIATLTSERDAAVRAQLEAQEGVKAAELGARQLSALLAERDRRIQALEAAAASGKVVSVGALLDGIGAQVAASANNVSKLSGAWQLSDVRLSLKVLVEDQGAKVRFPGLGEASASGGAEISTLDFGLKAGASTGGGASEPVRVPALVGYTGLLSERKLRALGLRTEVSYQTVVDAPGKPARAGRVVAQRPAAGAALQPGGTVELMIGKA